MEAFYLEIRTVHIGAVFASGGLFLLRSLVRNVIGSDWAMAPLVRWLAYAIDTVLLTAALMLMTIVRQYPFVHAWLTVKILLLVGYVVLAWHAFRTGTRERRILFTLAAALTYLFIITIARAHHPLGLLAG